VASGGVKRGSLTAEALVRTETSTPGISGVARNIFPVVLHPEFFSGVGEVYTQNFSAGFYTHNFSEGVYTQNFSGEFYTQNFSEGFYT
jgi:hypothetical protein